MFSQNFEAGQKYGFWMSAEFRQALKVLQMSDIELRSFLDVQVIQNPFLDKDEAVEDAELSKELDGDDEEVMLLPKKKNTSSDEEPHQEGIGIDKTLRDCVKDALSLYAENRQDYDIIDILVGYLDDDGYLSESLENISEYQGASLCRLKFFHEIMLKSEPVGVGSRNLQEFLLIYAVSKGIDSTHKYYRILDVCFKEFSSNRLSIVAKKLKLDVVDVENLKSLLKTWPMSPGYMFLDGHSSKDFIIPDLTVIIQKDGSCEPILNRKYNNVRYNAEYADSIEARPVEISDQEWKGLKQLRDSGKNIIHSVKKRSSLLLRVGAVLCKHHKDFFSGKSSTVTALSMRDVAKELGVHDSLINRTVMGKFLSTAHGIFPMKRMFARAVSIKPGIGDKSSHYLEEQLKHLISEEDKSNPLSDSELAEKLNDVGVVCARRTVSKYRAKLKLQGAPMRKRFVE